VSIVLVPDHWPQVRVGSIAVLTPSARRLRKGTGTLSGSFPNGITSVDGVPAPAEVRVLLHTPSGGYGDGVVVAVTQSSAAGTWSVSGLPLDLTYDVVCRHESFNDLILSNVTPKPM
jgi:hypothetical protein